MKNNETFNDLVEQYEAALKAYGLSCASRLENVNRANAIIRRHEVLGKEQLENAVIADYFNEINERYYCGEIGKHYWRTLSREVDRFLHFIQTGGVKLSNPTKGSRCTLLPEFQEIADDFLGGKAFHPNTRNDARWAVNKYFTWLAEQGYSTLVGVKVEQIQKFLLYCAQNLTMGSVHDIKLYIKKLYAYLHQQGFAESSYHELLSFSVKRGTRLQPILQQHEIAKLLETINRNTMSGKRAYAIMLLGIVFGLRACDVVKLKLTDIDWVSGEIKILQSKTAQTVVLPLTADVGEALSDYILNARPKVSFDKIFIRLNAPFEPLKAAVTIGEIYRDCCKAAGLPSHKINKRFHTLRRSLGTSMVISGTPIGTVAQVLGHAEIDSTKKYISLDSEHLKICALPFDGILPKERTAMIGGVFV